MAASPTLYVVDRDDPARAEACASLEPLGFKIKPCVDGVELLRRLDPTQPGCLLIDAAARCGDGEKLLECLRSRSISQPIVVYTSEATVPTAVWAMKHGARDFVEKPFDPTDLRDRIRSILKNGNGKSAAGSTSENPALRFARLSDRERSVLRLVMSGCATKQIAPALQISEKTVETYRSQIMKKLEVRGIPALVRLTLAHMPGIESAAFARPPSHRANAESDGTTSAGRPAAAPLQAAEERE